MAIIRELNIQLICFMSGVMLVGVCGGGGGGQTVIPRNLFIVACL